MFKHKHNMKFKTLTIKESVYRELLKTKGEGESFSNLFERMVKATKTRPDLMRFAGAWKMSGEDYIKVKSAVKWHRRAFNKSFGERLKRLGLK